MYLQNDYYLIMIMYSLSKDCGITSCYNADENILTKYGGMNINHLNNVLNVAINKNEETEIYLIKHSPYVNTDELMSFCVEKANNFTMLSLNVQSLNAKFNQIRILLSQLKSKHVQFNAICLQETWLTDNSDLTLFQILGYTLISPGAICSSHAGLVIYVQEHYIYKLLSCYQHTYNVIIKRSIFIAKKTYYHHIFQKYSSDIKNTWSIIKNLLHKKKQSNHHIIK